MGLIDVQVDSIPFLHRTTLVFCIDMVIMVIVSLTDPAGYANGKSVIVDKKMFRVTPSFVAGSVVIFAILAVLYIKFW